MTEETERVLQFHEEDTALPGHPPPLTILLEKTGRDFKKLLETLFCEYSVHDQQNIW